jgi:hypothetical protein
MPFLISVVYVVTNLLSLFMFMITPDDGLSGQDVLYLNCLELNKCVVVNWCTMPSWRASQSVLSQSACNRHSFMFLHFKALSASIIYAFRCATVFYEAWNCEKLKRSPWGRCPWRHTGSSFRAVAYRRCDALGRDTKDKVWTAFRCAVGKGHVHILIGLTGTSTSHPGVSGIRGNKATLPPSGVDGLLFRLLGQASTNSRLVAAQPVV